MFCPKCGIENKLDQKYCRACGHNLEGHRIALEKSLEEIRSRVKAGAVMMGVALAGLTFYIIISFIASLVEKNPPGASFTIAGLLFMLPIAVIGLLSITRALRALKGQSHNQAINESGEKRDELPASPTNPIVSLPKEPPSVTEQTTVRLEKPEQSRKT